MSDRPRSVLVGGHAFGDAARPMLSALEGLCAVAFVGSRNEVAPAAAMVVDSESLLDNAFSAAAPTVSLIVPPTPGVHEKSHPRRGLIRFANCAEVPWPFRGRLVASPLAVATPSWQPIAGETVLATDDEGRPLWTLSCKAGARIHRSALLLPASTLPSESALADSGAVILHLLPLLQTLREANGCEADDSPPLRASFVIDDPNLHWPTYGFANYLEIARHAAAHNHHVGFATIPLDAWFTHSGTASIFRAHPQHISLLIHGNNHSRQELARSDSPVAAAALLRQAIKRIESLEARARVSVSRVMVPPHGACSDAMLRMLPAHGFEAACVSGGSLAAHNPGRAWTRALGLAPSELIEGCPVLPRWSMTNATEATLLAAAYLGQPLVLRGHQLDLKDGLDVFASHAAFINSLGSVRWADLSSLSRWSYRSRREGASCRVRPFSHRISVDVAPGVHELIVEAGSEAQSAFGRNGIVVHAPAGAELRLSVSAGESINVQRHVARLGTTVQDGVRPTGVALVARRLATEARDRVTAFATSSIRPQRLFRQTRPTP